MNLSIFARNLRGPFMIHPMAAAAVMPLIHGVIAGNEIDFDSDDRRESRKVACSDFWSGAKHEAGEPFAGKSVFVCYLEGTMTRYDTCESWGTCTIADDLLHADADPEVIGHIIVTDSGGGAADSVPELSEAIGKLSKPVVAWIDGMAASAAIYAISYCQKIIAHRPMNEVGCIGTMITVSGWPKFRRDSDGYVKARIYASQSDEKNADYEAALEGNVQLIRENLLDPLAEQFINDIKANRPGVTDDQTKGRTYFAKDVVGSLIDSIGDFSSAMDAVMELAAAKQGEDGNSISAMKYQNLESIPELQEQVYAEDGSTVLQECQLQAVDAALASLAETSGLHDQVTALTQTVADRNATIAQHEATIAQRDARIAELEAALDAAADRNSQEQPAGVDVEADTVHHEGDAASPAKNRAEAEAACREFLKRNNS